MKRAVIYARVSYDDRAQTGGRNLEGQLEDGRAYCQEKGYTIVAELAEDDRGASGASWDLPKLNEALDMARAGEFDVLVTRELDRFARSLAKQLVIEDEFKRCGVDVEYILASYDDSPEGRLNKHIRATIAEFEREKIAQRMTRGRRLAVKGGKILLHGGGKAPYGYTLEDGQLVICEEEAETVRRIFTWYVHGDENGQRLTLGDIASRLTAMEIPTWADSRGVNLRKTRGRCQWSKDTLRKFLGNETYTGTWHYAKYGEEKVNPKDHWLSVEVPAVIDRETWEKAQEQRVQNRDLSKRNTKNFYLLARRVTCECGATMRAKTNNWGNSYYICQNAAGRLAVKDCDAPYFRSDHVDAVVWEWLESLYYDPENFGKKIREWMIQEREGSQHLVDRLGAIDDLIAKNQRELRKLLDIYLTSEDLTKDMLTDRKTRLEKVIKSLEREKVELQAGLSDFVAFDDERIDRIVESYAREWRDHVKAIHDAPQHIVQDIQREAVDDLNMRAVLALDENGEKIARIRCTIATGVVSIENTNIRIRTWA